MDLSIRKTGCTEKRFLCTPPVFMIATQHRFICPKKGAVMFIAENLILALAKMLDIALTLYMWIIIARAVISWVNPDPYNPIVMFLYRVTEPVLAPVRRWLPFRNLGIDISPIIVIMAIIFLQNFLVRSMMQMATTMR
ncbi:hypothetical membrane protein [Syntrophus aciditrophicus SB]|uniref:Hypothetical membrane protein n=2 Tax=Syntrophus TaxID=43773 RepID=Q2LU56_SYNAS|nr:hypothetical membrane protein [Syntrophus aciditrophicus SB]